MTLSISPRTQPTSSTDPAAKRATWPLPPVAESARTARRQLAAQLCEWRLPRLVDDATLTLPAARCFDTDEHGIPVGSRSVDGTPADLRQARPIGNRVLDTAYADLSRNTDGRWRARLQGPDGGVELWADAAYGYAQVFTGDTLPEPLRRRGVAVEPMTCPPDAFNAADGAAAGVVVLEPGEEHEATWGIRPL